MPTLIEGHPIHFLTPHRPGFWSWDGGSIAFVAGPTLTFREELFAVIQHLQPYGLPPIESLLLFLAATRDPWSGTAHGNLQIAWRDSLGAYDSALLSRHLPADWWEKVSAELARVRGLERSWRQEARKKCLLAEVCFERADTLRSPDHAQSVADLLELGFVAPSPAPREDPESAVRRLAEGLRPLLQGLPALREDRLEVRLRTGLDVAISGGTDPEPSLAMQVRALLSDLADDPEWTGLARLARNLMAAVHVPRALGDPDELPLGGFSDISNRGALDRLLISELAQDDWILSARLALKEALYLRRESPPKAPQVRRALLVDNGLRLWGTPRLFGTAVALAMEAMSDGDTKVDSYVPTEHQQLCEVRLQTREGLLQALSHLHPHAHPGNALLELARRVKGLEGPCEMILITHADVFSDPAFQTVLALISEPFYAATVDRSGAYVFYRCRQASRRVLGQARVDLTSLLPDPGEAALLRREDVPAHLPAIFHQRPFPIRLPAASLRGRTVFTREDGIYKTVRDGRLLHFDDANRGGVQICEDLPAGKSIPVVEVHPLGEERRVVALQGKRRLSLALVHPLSGHFDLIAVPLERAPLQILVVHQHVLIIQARRITMHAIRSGEQIAELALAGRVDRCYGDLILMGSEWQRVSIDGMGPCLETVDQDGILVSSRMEEFGLTTDRALRKHFRGIALEARQLILFPRKSGKALAIAFDSASTGTLRLRPVEATAEPILFRPLAGPAGSRVDYREAVWADGSRVVLDSRGLLHFASASAEIAQFTLILADAGCLSAWLGSLGGMGDSYYFHEPPCASAAQAGRLLEAFIMQLVRPC